KEPAARIASSASSRIAANYKAQSASARNGSILVSALTWRDGEKGKAWSIPTVRRSVCCRYDSVCSRLWSRQPCLGMRFFVNRITTDYGSELCFVQKHLRFLSLSKSYPRSSL
ncbi:unnamed protein product, partial [Urochloa humidicola]